MIETTLKEIEKNVKKDASTKETIINDFKIEIKKRKMKQGRVRPRNRIEQNILDSFEQK